MQISAASKKVKRFFIGTSWNSDNQFSHSGIVVLVVNTESDHMFARCQIAGKITKRFRFRIDDAVSRKYRPPIPGIDGDLSLTQCRRLVRRVDSNSSTAAINSFQLHLNDRGCIIDYKRSALHFSFERQIRRVRRSIARNNANDVRAIGQRVGVNRKKVSSNVPLQKLPGPLVLLAVVKVINEGVLVLIGCGPLERLRPSLRNPTGRNWWNLRQPRTRVRADRGWIVRIYSISRIQGDLLQSDRGRQNLDIRNLRPEVLLQKRDLYRTQPRRRRAVRLKDSLPLNESGFWAGCCAGRINFLPIRPGFVWGVRIAGSCRDFDIAASGLPRKSSPGRHGFRILDDRLVSPCGGQRVADPEQLSNVRRGRVYAVAGLEQACSLFLGGFDNERDISRPIHRIDAAFGTGGE